MPAISISLPHRELMLLEKEANGEPRQRSRIIAHLIRTNLQPAEPRLCVRCEKVSLTDDQDLHCDVCEYELKEKVRELEGGVTDA